MIYHVLNRGNGRLRLFHNEGDYDAFEQVLIEGLKRHPVDLLTYCLMPDHWHLVVRPGTDIALGRLTGWIGVTHVRRHQERYHRRGTGHLYQGRFKSFPVAEDKYFLSLCRYVEANAVRGKLVESVQQWRWCAPWRRVHPSREFVLSPWPVNRPRKWTALVDGGLSKEELQLVRDCVRRGRPLGPRALGAGDRRPVETGVHTPRTWPAQKRRPTVSEVPFPSGRERGKMPIPAVFAAAVDEALSTAAKVGR